MTRINLLARTRGYQIPPLYDSGVLYEREEPGTEEWLCAPEVIRRGRADCEDLACYRASELIANGHHARAIALPPHERVGGSKLYHIVVDRVGEIEDPSRKLGM